MRFARLDVEDQPAPAGSDEIVLADAGGLRIIFLNARNTVTVADFSGYAQSVYGYPNDEAAEPLYPDLLYGFYEILDSDWNERLTAQNMKSFPDPDVKFNRKHFLVLFHETSLEVLAHSVSLTTFPDSFGTVAEASMRLFATQERAPSVVPQSEE